MKCKIFLYAFTAVFSFQFLVFSFVFADQNLKPQGFVNDFAGMFSPPFRASLEQDLQNFETQTSAEISVVTVNSLEGNSIEDYAATLFEQWGIGKKTKNNGVLLLIAKEERKARIEVGYGSEPYITDGRAGRIIRTIITPNFKKRAYDEGVKEAVDSIKNYIIAGEPETGQEVVRENIKRVLPAFFESDGGFFLLVFLGLYFFNFFARSKRIWPGGVFGVVIGVFLGWLFISLFLGIALFFVLGAVGLFLDYILSKNYQTRKAMGLPIGFWASGGGFRGGRGGGFSGFGGFGGGSSGGGGASGSW